VQTNEEVNWLKQNSDVIQGYFSVVNTNRRFESFFLLAPIEIKIPQSTFYIKETRKNKKTILIIEDEVHTSETSFGRYCIVRFGTLVAENGLQGLELAKESIWLIICDLLMPELRLAMVY
jgi:hypothetical protein